jgi:hypothetical protein
MTCSKSALGAQPPLIGVHNFLTQIDRIGSHIAQASAALSDDQV